MLDDLDQKLRLTKISGSNVTKQQLQLFVDIHDSGIQSYQWLETEDLIIDADIHQELKYLVKQP
jgi:DUF971 family protein